MLSWLEFARWALVLRVFRRRWVVRGISGCWMLSLAWMRVAEFVCGGSLCGVVALRWQAFLGGFCVDE